MLGIEEQLRHHFTGGGTVIGGRGKVKKLVKHVLSKVCDNPSGDPARKVVTAKASKASNDREADENEGSDAEGRRVVLNQTPINQGLYKLRKEGSHRRIDHHRDDGQEELFPVGDRIAKESPVDHKARGCDLFRVLSLHEGSSSSA